MKLSLDLLEELVEEVYPPEALANEINRRVEEQVAAEVASKVTVFNVWLHQHRVLDKLQSGEYSLHRTPDQPYLRYSGPKD